MCFFQNARKVVFLHAPKHRPAPLLSQAAINVFYNKMLSTSYFITFTSSQLRKKCTTSMIHKSKKKNGVAFTSTLSHIM